MTDPIKFVKRVPENQGIQWDGSLAVADLIEDWLGADFRAWVTPDLTALVIERVVGGDMVALSPGQWVIRQNGDPPRAFDDATVATKFRVYAEGD